MIFVFISNVFFKDDVYQGCIYWNKNSNIVQYYSNNKKKSFLFLCFEMSFISVIKAVFSASLLQSSVSHDLHKSYNMWFAAEKHAENSCAA